MADSDLGYGFNFVHNDEGSTALITAHYRRYQEDAPIAANQPFALDFYGVGWSIELGVTALPRLAAPAALATARRPRRRTRRAPSSSPQDAIVVPAVPASNVLLPRMRLDDDWLDWDDPPILEQPPGGGAGTRHAGVRIELFIWGNRQPLQTWELPEGIDSAFLRTVRFEQEGMPTSDSPALRKGWWRMVATPLGVDPVRISISAKANVERARVKDLRLSARLADHVFRVALEALMPDAWIQGGRVFASIGQEVADLLGIDSVIVDKTLPLVEADSQLRSVSITTVSGDTLRTNVIKHYEEVVERLPPPSPSAPRPTVASIYEKQLTRLEDVKPDDVCIRIQAGFTGATFSIWGFDVASIQGELGEVYLAFDHRCATMRPFALFDADLAAVPGFIYEIADLFFEVPKNVNEAIEDALVEQRTPISDYMRAFLERVVGPGTAFHSFRFADESWRLRYSVDPEIPTRKGPGPVRPDPPISPSDDPAILVRIERPLVGRPGESVGAAAADPTVFPARASAAVRTTSSRKLPAGFLTEGERLDRLDRHTCIAVVMMENRSYDHLLGDLPNARPRPSDAYDGVRFSAATNSASAGGFLDNVPLVKARDLLIGTAIPVSPRHFYNPIQFQIGDGTIEGASSGDMLGFARDVHRRTDSPQLACTVYGEEDVPAHYRLADEFLTCDRWFSAHPGPTQPNRFATLTGRIPDLDNFENDDPRIGFLDLPCVFDALTAAGIEWRVFESDLSMIRMFDKYRLDDKNVVPLDDPTDGLEATLRGGGPLPRVMFIEPNFVDIPPLKTADDDHPPADLKHGQEFLKRVCDLIWDTGRFDEVLLVITYDEHGGFYDHVPPPGTPKSDLPGPYPPLIPGGPTWLGVRVPTFVVSPYVSAGARSEVVFDHTSILKTILVHNRVELSTDVLLSFGDRVNQAKDLSEVLDLENARPAPVPFVRRLMSQARERNTRDLSDLGGALERVRVTQPFIWRAGADSTPRRVLFTPRTAKPADGAGERRDHHAALARVLRPRMAPRIRSEMLIQRGQRRR